jgi:hypothetical protein
VQLVERGLNFEGDEPCLMCHASAGRDCEYAMAKILRLLQHSGQLQSLR